MTKEEALKLALGFAESNKLELGNLVSYHLSTAQEAQELANELGINAQKEDFDDYWYFNFNYLKPCELEIGMKVRDKDGIVCLLDN